MMCLRLNSEIAPVFWPVSMRKISPEWASEAGQLRVLELHSTRVPGNDGGCRARSPKERDLPFRRADITSYSAKTGGHARAPDPRDAPATGQPAIRWLTSDRYN